MNEAVMLFPGALSECTLLISCPEEKVPFRITPNLFLRKVTTDAWLPLVPSNNPVMAPAAVGVKCQATASNVTWSSR